MARALGFDATAAEEIALAVGELASNLVKHAGGGKITVMALAEEGRSGLQVISCDLGPGIADIRRALTDGVSTADTQGNGLGAVNRLMDSLEITSPCSEGGGTEIVCRRWLRARGSTLTSCSLEFGVATRAHPLMDLNGDAFVIKSWDGGALVGVIDGLGHGEHAHHAAETARQYVEAHFDQPLEAIFRGTDHACLATRGVVMALARFACSAILSAPLETTMAFASIGNIEARVFNAPDPPKLIVRRGVLGLNAPHVIVTQTPWTVHTVLVLHSDGLSAHWRQEDFPLLFQASAATIAQTLLQALAKENDDATVVVARERSIGTH